MEVCIKGCGNPPTAALKRLGTVLFLQVLLHIKDKVRCNDAVDALGVKGNLHRLVLVALLGSYNAVLIHFVQDQVFACLKLGVAACLIGAVRREAGRRGEHCSQVGRLKYGDV